MARSKSDISNSAIRIFLQDVGKFYDEARGFDPFGPKVSQKDELLDFFKHECCFCGAEINRKNYDPSLNLHEYADNLYEDVGQVAMTLLNLRYKQAQDGIKKLLK